MKRAWLGALFCAIVAATRLPAADFWTTDFLQWSDKEVAKMLTDSPWAAEESVRPRGSGGPPSGLAALAQMETFTIAWRSARPVMPGPLRERPSPQR